MSTVKDLADVKPAERERCAREILTSWEVTEPQPLCSKAKRITKKEAIELHVSRMQVTKSQGLVV